MRIDVFHHVSFDDPTIIDLLTTIKQEIQKMASDTQTAIARLQADVTAQTTVIASANTLFAQLSQLIRDNTADPVALNALADSLEGGTGSLSAAIVANTPAAAPAGGGGTPIEPPSGGPTSGPTGG